jgi:hypothetical protein
MRLEAAAMAAPEYRMADAPQDLAAPDIAGLAQDIAPAAAGAGTVRSECHPAAAAAHCQKCCRTGQRPAQWQASHQ